MFNPSTRSFFLGCLSSLTQRLVLSAAFWWCTTIIIIITITIVIVIITTGGADVISYFPFKMFLETQSRTNRFWQHWYNVEIFNNLWRTRPDMPRDPHGVPIFQMNLDLSNDDNGKLCLLTLRQRIMMTRHVSWPVELLFMKLLTDDACIEIHQRRQYSSYLIDLELSNDKPL